jgi:hypothetical protein
MKLISISILPSSGLRVPVKGPTQAREKSEACDQDYFAKGKIIAKKR